MQDPAAYESYKTIATRDAICTPIDCSANMKWELSEKILSDHGYGAGINYMLPIRKALNSKMFSVDISNKIVEFDKKSYLDKAIT